MLQQDKKFTYSVPWNCFLILAGMFIQAIGFKALGEPQGFFPGGLFGVATLIHYMNGALNTVVFYLLLNIPMFILGYILCHQALPRLQFGHHGFTVAVLHADRLQD